VKGVERRVKNAGCRVRVVGCRVQGADRLDFGLEPLRGTVQVEPAHGNRRQLVVCNHATLSLQMALIPSQLLQRLPNPQGFILKRIYQLVSESQLPHKIVNVMSTITNNNVKFTVLWGS